MQIKKIAIAFLFTLPVVFFSNCKKDKGNDSELITTLELMSASGVTYKWEDLEGDGNPAVDTIRLSLGAPVNFSASFFNRSGGRNTNITSEIEAENTAHLLVYQSPSSSLYITTTDFDANGDAFGLQTQWTAGAPGSSMVTITLKHQADKAAPDPLATGETDLQVSFPVIVQ